MRRGNRRWGRWLIVVYVLPAAVLVPVALAMGEWMGALAVAGGIGSLFAAAWFVNPIFEPQRDREQGPE